MGTKRYRYILTVVPMVCCSLLGAQGFENADYWPFLVQKIRASATQGSPAQDFSLSFHYFDDRSEMSQHSMSYSLQGDGSAVITDNDGSTIRVTVSGREIDALCSELFRNGFAELKTDSDIRDDTCAYSVSLSRGGYQSKVFQWLPQSGADTQRSIVWQYLYRFGQYSRGTASAQGGQGQVLPVCEGITDTKQIDSDGDGIVDWVKYSIAFYAFKPVTCRVCFTTAENMDFPKGRSVKELYVNSAAFGRGLDPVDDFDLRPLRVPEKIMVSTLDGRDTFSMPLYRETPDMQQSSFNNNPDAAFRGTGPWRIVVHKGQTVFYRFSCIRNHDVQTLKGSISLEEIHRDAVMVEGTIPGLIKRKDPLELGVFYKAVSGTMTLVDIKGSSAVFEVGWNMPDSKELDRLIQALEDLMRMPNFSLSAGILGDKMISLKAQKAFIGMLKSGDMKFSIDLYYSRPPVIIF